MKQNRRYCPLLLVLLLLVLPMAAQQKQPVTVDVDHPKGVIQPTMWGIFFEDINFAADGGLYAELVMNRSFEFFIPRTGWKVRARTKDSSALIMLNRSGSSAANPRFARVKVAPDMPSYCLTNTGFRGMGIKTGNTYHFSVLAAMPLGGSMKMRIELTDSKGAVAGQTTLTVQGGEWKKYTADLVSELTDAHGRMNIWFEDKGAIDIDMVSLFPHDTWKNRPGGLRADLAQLLADLKPGFVRFPGGCIVEGRELATRYQWKTTVGPVEERKMIVNRWNTEFRHRLTPDYFQTFGLGFYEYFLLAEDIGAEPLPILNCGMACQFNTAEVATLDQLDPYIQDALDLIEFANGDESTPWGKLRASMGHPAPFNLKMIGIGNEQWGPQYFERYQLFEKAILEKYPNITLITSSGPAPDGDLFDFAWNELKSFTHQVVDEHYYRDPDWFLKHADRYDSYDRSGHKVFAGEYAAQSVYTTSPDNQNNWQCALAEAAFMTGLERNADLVTMSSYAPLMAHVDGWQWKPDLIWFDNLRSFATPNYYVQQLFSTNRGSQVLPMLYEGKPLTGQHGLYATAAWDDVTKEIILKVVNATGASVSQSFNLKGSGRYATTAKLIILQHNELTAVNSLDKHEVKPVERVITIRGKTIDLVLEPYSLNVIRIKKK